MRKALDEKFSFRTWPFYWLARANGRYLQGMEVALQPLGLDIPRWRVLMILQEDGRASIGELAEHAIAKLPTMTRIVQRMQADALVRCYPRKTDGRVTEVVLTELGEVAGAAAWNAANQIYGSAFRNMKNSEIEALTNLLQNLAKNLVK